MPEPAQPFILILSSSFGEGHNSAAKNLAQALKGQARVEILLPNETAQKQLHKILRWAYLKIITHFPSLWKAIYRYTDKQDLSQESLGFLRKTRQFLYRFLDEKQPDLVVCTYPLHPYLLDDYNKRTARPLPHNTIITDSLFINKSWKCSQTGHFFLTDTETQSRLIQDGLEPSRLHVTGFAVSPRFASLSPLKETDWQKESPPKVLYFANRGKKATQREVKTILQSHPTLELTVILGKKTRSLYPLLRPFKQEFGSRLKIKGWTQKVPELLCSHHLLIGKAGGATTHECLAAATPLLVNHFLYGQEEGNLELLTSLGMARQALDSTQLKKQLQALFLGEHPEWFELKKCALTARQTDGATRIAQHLLQSLSSSSYHDLPPRR